ncbi:MAG TPA: cytochrome c peroxidase [Verrucomicrobiae bacterium]|jgi:cytochrome c peroxidase
MKKAELNPGAKPGHSLFLQTTALAGLVLMAGLAPSQADSGPGKGGVPAPAPAPGAAGAKSLKGVAIPLPANLSSFVSDQAAAIKLGKALFWDMTVGGDGRQACASCHFQAGSDVRTKNQLHPRASAPGVFSPNHSMAPADFPINNGMVMGSAGLPKTGFLNIIPSSPADNGVSIPDAVFNVAGHNIRQVTGRNTPSAVNAIFNFRSFWDGRANNAFNGVNPAGPGDAAARVLQVIGGVPTKVSISLSPASLASQAVGPPNNGVEMSYDGRNFLQLGKKMMTCRPLKQQVVSPTDSVLGGLTAGVATGLNTTYPAMIKAAFRSEFWDSTAIVDANKNVITPTGAANEFRVIEANFSLFWGLSIMLYESTLVSDNTRYDQFVDGNAGALSTTEQAGLAVFRGKGRCASCHKEPELTQATAGNNQINGGFLNTAVRPVADDGGDILQPGLAKFKTPGLRNTELNGPYFHNGNQATLMEVVNFYNRGGDFVNANTDGNIRPLGLTDTEKSSLVSFMMALTDERVRNQSAPFDHPQLFLNNGADALGADILVELPATGAGGSAPVSTFLGMNPQQP